MNKKKLFVIIIFASFALLTAVFIYDGRKNTFNEYYFSSLTVNSFDDICQSRKEAKIPLQELTFNDFPLFYDEDDACFYYSLSGNEKKAYDPLVKWNANTFNIAIENVKINEDLIKNNETITLCIYDDKRYSIQKLKCTTLPLINISKFYDDLHFEYDDCSITVLDNTAENISTYDGRVRIRGGSSAEYPKPGLRIKLDKALKGDNNTNEKYYNIFGLEPDNEFVLFTSNFEKDHIRNVFTTNLWYDTCAADNSLGMKFGMSYRYCEVFINNKYWGLCALGNPIDEKRAYVDLDKNSDKFLKENIYKLNFFGERVKLDYEKYGNDYLFSIKTNEEYEESWQPFIDYIQLLLYSKDIDALYNSVDIDNALDIYLFYNMVQAWDNAWFEDNLKFRNTYLISKVSDTGIKMIYIPWDLDRCWGHEREDGLDYPLDYQKNYDMVINPIENLLELDDENIRKLVWEKYQFLRSDKWSDENILKMLDIYEKQAYGSGAFFRDKDRWPDNYHGDFTDLTQFKNYVMERIHYFDTYITEKFSQS